MSMNDCVTARCIERATHTLTTKVLSGPIAGHLQVNEYCLEHALYFAAWLPYCYPGEYELVSITPPASELFDG